MRISNILSIAAIIAALGAVSACVEEKSETAAHCQTEKKLENRVYHYDKKDYVIYYKSDYSEQPTHYLGNCYTKWWDYKTGHPLGNGPTQATMSTICKGRKDAKEILPREQLYIDFPDLPRGMKRITERPYYDYHDGPDDVDLPSDSKEQQE